MNTLRPNAQRAKIAILFIWVMLIVSIIMLISDIFEYQLLQKVKTGTGYTEADLTSTIFRQGGIALIYLAATIISGITFIQWFRRAYYNLHQKVQNLSYTEGWAAGGWFVPIMSLVVPFRIMKELYTKTDELIYGERENPRTGSENTALIIWWVLWILSAVVATILYVLLKDESTDGLILQSVVGMVIDTVGILSALITVKVIKGYSEKESGLLLLPEETAQEEVFTEDENVEQLGE